MLARSLLALVGRQAMLAVPDRVRLDIGARHHERTRLAALAFGDLLHAAAEGDRSRVLLQDLRAILLDRMFVMMLDQQPVNANNPNIAFLHGHRILVLQLPQDRVVADRHAEPMHQVFTRATAHPVANQGHNLSQPFSSSHVGRSNLG